MSKKLNESSTNYPRVRCNDWLESYFSLEVNEMFQCHVNIGCRILSKRIQRIAFVIVAYFVIPMLVILQCCFSFASSNKQEVWEQSIGESFVFGEVFKNYHPATFSLPDSVDSFLDSTVEVVKTYLSWNKKSNNSSDKNTDDSNDDPWVHVALLVTWICLFVAVYKSLTFNIWYSFFPISYLEAS